MKKFKRKYKIIDEDVKRVIKLFVSTLVLFGVVNYLPYIIYFGLLVIDYIDKNLLPVFYVITYYLKWVLYILFFIFSIYFVWTQLKLSYYKIYKRKFIPLTKDELKNNNINTIDDYIKVLREYLTVKFFFCKPSIIDPFVIEPYNKDDFINSFVENFDLNKNIIIYNYEKFIYDVFESNVSFPFDRYKKSTLN